MRKTTDLNSLKELANAFLHLDPIFNKDVPFIITHPYIESLVTSDLKGNLLDVRIPDQWEKLMQIYSDQITKANSIDDIMYRMRLPYHFAFLKYAKQYMSKKDFDTWLGTTWTSSENPNQDKNVTINQFITWFKAADKKLLMEEEDYKVYAELPEEITIYRGVAVGRAKQKGLSWTCNIDTARWFSERFDTNKKKGYILKAKIKKSDVFAYFNTRNEDEILCNSKNIYDIERI